MKWGLLMMLAGWAVGAMTIFVFWLAYSFITWTIPTSMDHQFVRLIFLIFGGVGFLCGLSIGANDEQD